MKHLKKYNSFIIESNRLHDKFDFDKDNFVLNNDTPEEAKLRESYKARIEKFLSEFPDNPKHWGEATDELPDVHNQMAELYNEFVNEGEIDDTIYTGNEGRSQTPAEWNAKAKKGIRYLVDRLPVRLIKNYVIDHYGFF